MKAFLTPLQGLAEFEQIKEKSKTNKGILQVSGCMESQKSHLMYGLSGIAPYRLILAEDERRAREIYEDYRFYDRKVYSYPAKDLLFFQADIHGNLFFQQFSSSYYKDLLFSIKQCSIFTNCRNPDIIKYISFFSCKIPSSYGTVTF